MPCLEVQRAQDEIIDFNFLTMKKLEMNQMEKIEGGVFWGTGVKCKSVPGGTSCCNYDYMFWIRVSSGYNCSTTYESVF